MSIGKCKRCGSCCKVMVIPMHSLGFDYDWVAGRNGKVVGGDAIIPSVCKHLTEDNLCAVHAHKPTFCQTFPMRYGPQAWLANIGCKFYG